MDGNRRWASSKGVPLLEGHRAGLETAKKIAREAFNLGVSTLYYYAFSTENWKRPPEEVSYLLALFEKAILDEFNELVENGVRIRFIGDLERFPSKMKELMRTLEQKTVGGEKGTLVIALSYGGRAEILHAANKLIGEGREVVSESDVSSALWSAGLPDPDLIIRTSGEHRLSGFLTWQSVYSELIFTDILWPDYDVALFKAHMAEFAKRKRNFGV
jgi:undecaprenyl diphosphate synthase